MTIQNHILPASIAAAIHAALLWGWIETPPRTHTTIVEVPLPPLPPKPDDAVVQPPEDTSDTPPAVHPLASPAPITLDDPPLSPKATDITIPVEDQRTKSPHELTIVPTRFGPDEIGIEGGQTRRRVQRFLTPRSIEPFVDLGPDPFLRHGAGDRLGEKGRREAADDRDPLPRPVALGRQARDARRRAGEARQTGLVVADVAAQLCQG